MNRFYNISKGQLITIWIFGFIGWLVALDNTTSFYSSEPIYDLLSWIIPFLLIFYTIGWKNKNGKIGIWLFLKKILNIALKILRKLFSGVFGILIIILIIMIYGWNLYENYQLDSNINNDKVASDKIDLSKYKIEELKVGFEKVPYKDYVLYISDIKDLGKQVDDDFGYTFYSPSPRTEGDYKKITLYIENIGSIQNEILISNVKLIDKKDRVFYPNGNFNCSDNSESYGFLKKINKPVDLKPGIPCKFEYLFEVPLDLDFNYLLFSVK